MANNIFQVKRTTISGRTPNTTGSYITNSQYIAAGEFALNMADGILYTSNGSALIPIGANNTNVNITDTLTVKTISANGTIGSANQVLTSNGSSVYWSNGGGGGSGSVTSVDSGAGLTGGPITSTGTLAVGAGNGIKVNADDVAVNANNGITANSTGTFVTEGTGVVVNSIGVHVNASYIGTLSANNASYLGTVAAASYVQNTDSRTLSGNLVISGTYFNPSANTILLGNSTQRWVLSANSGDFTSTVNAVTSVNSALLTVGTSFIANTTGTYHTGVVNGATISTGTTFIANSTQITITLPLSANGSKGNAGDVLTSNGSTGSPYWVSGVGGYYKGGTSTIGTLALQGANIFRVNANTLNNDTTIATGENAQATGPLTVATGKTLTVQSGARVSIV